MKQRLILLAAAVALAAALVGPATAQILTYGQDFEGLIIVDPNALAADGWLVYGNVYDDLGVYQYGYGPFPAPNDGFAFCAVAEGQGGESQGLQQLSVYSDYNNGDHGAGWLIESNVYREWTVTAANVGEIWYFEFDAKLGNLVAPSTAAAFIKTLDPSSGWALTNSITLDTTNIPVEWYRYHLELPITADLEGQIFQIGFLNTATNYESSGIYYDNIEVYVGGSVDVPSPAHGAALAQNRPNPFNPSTRIGFDLDVDDTVNLSVYDLAGRRVATLVQGALPAGPHHVDWNGTTDAGTMAPAGQYRYVLTTSTGRLSHSMVLVK